MGYIYKPKLSPFWWIGYSNNGAPIRESTKTKIKSVAKKILAQREGEIVEGKCPSIYFAGVPFSELLEDYLQEYRITGKRSVRRAEQIVRCHLTRHFGDLPAAQIDTRRISGYIEARQREGAANATICRELAALKRAFRLAARQTPPKVQGVPYVPMLEIDNARQGFLNEEDFKKFRGALPEYLQGLVSFAYISGARKEEIIRLTWDRVDREAGVVKLSAGDTKTKTARTIPLDGELQTIIKAAFAKQQIGCPYVFQRDGKKIGDLRKAWNKACAAIGRPGYSGDRETNLTMHDMRRSAVRNMRRSGVSETEAMRITGHRTRAMLDRYSIVSEADLHEAAAKVEARRNKAGNSQNTHNE